LVVFKNQVKAIRPEQDAQGTTKDTIKLLSALIASQASCLVAFSPVSSALMVYSTTAEVVLPL